MEQLWINPNAGQASTMRAVYGEATYGDAIYGAGFRFGPSLDINRVRVASEFAPQTSPAPAGNAIVPEGWVRQMGDEGENDMALADIRNGALQYDATMTPITVPINSGGWPPLPAGFPLNP
jgi:hypothetical protein